MGWFSDLLGAARDRLRRRRREPAPAEQHPDIESLLVHLDLLGSGFPTGDGVGAFHAMYRRVTALVGDEITAGRFADREFLTRLDVVFAGYYLEAASAPSPNRAWAPVFADRADSRRAPIQFALAGMNAHINHDLGLAVVRTCRQLGLTPDSPGVRADYRRVTDVLALVQEEVRQSFLSGLALEADRRFAPVANLIATWSIAKAREAAWANAEVLWELRGSGSVEAAYLDSLAGSVGMVGRYLLTPVTDLV
ncbi:hypothetical protein EXU48_01965 [Occultella glacieicola]|uniref:Uncharacterized protein n=1 Tax=Occultella glacieicola TaxID=2518684 RepID=A0ABY2E9M5_9MICO|nr:DUF5995 family protein [Occultella glacieicola]TDE98978.1 hypothetical protein EXU48_01965 [Occultella glacieicola]